MKKCVPEIYEEIKKEAREFAKKEGLKLSITRRDYNVITITVVKGKEKVLNNSNRSTDLFYDKDLNKNYNEYLNEINNLIKVHTNEETYHEKEIATRLSNQKMTKYGFEIAKKLNEIMHKNYWDDSDYITDYVHVAFYGNLYLGSYEKPYTIKEVA